MASKIQDIPLTPAYSVVNALWVAVFLSFAIWYLRFHWNRRRLYKMCAKIPQIKANLPIAGIGLNLMGNKEKSLKTLYRYCEEGPVVMGWLGHRPVTLLHSPEDLEIVFNSSKALAKFDLYGFMDILLGNGLITAPVHIWKPHRKAITPTFNQKILNNFFNVFVKQSEILVNVLQDSVGKIENISDQINHWGLDTICETAMGVNVESQSKDCLLVFSIHRAMAILFERIFNVLYHNNFIYQISSLGKEGVKMVNCIHDFVMDVLKEKYLSFEKLRLERIATPEAEIDETPKLVAFLDLFMELTVDKGKFSDEELRDEATTIILAGSETTATSVGYALLLLGMNPDVQQKVYEEVIDVLGPNRQISLADLPLFKYMDRVIKETLRILPTIPSIYRNVDEDLEITSYTLPKGSAVGFAILNLHRSPVYWPNPLKFDPDRFLPENVAKRHPYAYVPFAGGPRNCIGIKYAIMSMKTVLALLVRRYHIATPYKSVEDIRLRQDIVIRSIDGYPVKLTDRHEK